MFSLLLKEFLILKKHILWMVLLIAAASYFLFSTLATSASPIPAAVVVVTYTLSLQSCLLDDKAGSELILLSFPLRRRDIVRVKYLSLFIYALSVSLSIVVLQFGKAWLLHSPRLPFTWGILLTSVVAAAFMGSIYYPFYFRLGYVKSRVVTQIIFFAFFFGSLFAVPLLFMSPSKAPAVRVLVGALRWLHGLNMPALAVLALLFTLLFSGGSHLLSLRFYERREF